MNVALGGFLIWLAMSASVSITCKAITPWESWKRCIQWGAGGITLITGVIAACVLGLWIMAGFPPL